MNAQPQHPDWPGMVYDYLVDHPDGADIHDLSEHLDMPIRTTRQAVRDARVILAKGGDTLFILAEPQGQRQPWIYKLVDGKSIIDVNESGWIGNRIGDAQSRIQLIHYGMMVAENATDGRTTDGRKARLLSRHLGRLIEDLEEIDHGLGPVE